MSSEKLNEFEIPEGLNDLLHDFAVSVLIEKPENLHDYAADYFTRLRNEKKPKAIPMYIIVDDADAGEPETVRKLTEKNKVARRKSVSAERYNPEDDDEDDETALPVHPKTDRQRALLTEAVKQILLFRKLDDEQRMTVIDAMKENKVVKGETVIKQGDDGDYFYVIESGVYNICRESETEGKTILHVLEDKGSFGELALMYSQPRSATVEAVSDGVLWALDGTSFQRIVTRESFRMRQMYEQLLSKVPILKTLSDDERSSVVDGLCTKVYYNNDSIILRGEEGDGIYFIEHGVCSVCIDKGDGEVEVKQLGKGQYFGELALLDNSKRSASIYAVSKVKCGFLARDAFERLLGPCKDLMKRATVDFEFGN